MNLRTLIAAGGLLAVASVAQAQQSPTYFERAAYVTCREAHAMTPEARKTLAGYLAEHAAQHRGVTIPNDDRGTQIAYLVRGGCTLAPDAYLFTVIDRGNRQVAKALGVLPFARAVVKPLQLADEEVRPPTRHPPPPQRSQDDTHSAPYGARPEPSGSQ
jgi:hypothetical protein